VGRGSAVISERPYLTETLPDGAKLMYQRSRLGYAYCDGRSLVSSFEIVCISDALEIVPRSLVMKWVMPLSALFCCSGDGLDFACCILCVPVVEGKGTLWVDISV
jgi:hypothetical protein